MRIKVRFNSEGTNQPTMVLELRFLPRAGEHIHVGFRRVIEVLEVHRVDNDNRCGGIIRAKYVQEHTNVAAPLPAPRPVNPFPSPIPSPAVAAAAAAKAALYGDLSFEELMAAHAQAGA